MANQALNVKQGCYLIRFEPSESIPDVRDFDGTLRVENDGETITASGDLYVHRMDRDREEPDPAKGIPIFPIDDYRYWLHITQVTPEYEKPGSLKAFFEPHRLDREQEMFINRGTFVANLTKESAPAGYPSSSDFFKGKVTEKQSGAVFGTLSMGWVSDYLRRAQIEIDSVQGGDSPGVDANEVAAGLDWTKIFGEVGWEVTFDKADSDTNLSAPDPGRNPGGFWNEGELHQQMLYSRSPSTDLNKEWHYFLLCVERITDQDRGVMFDVGGSDSDNLPREGAAIAFGWPVPDGPEWGNPNDDPKPFGKLERAYFRTGVHEIGHTMGLDHNFVNNGFMNTTETIVANLEAAGKKFPDGIPLSFASDDAKRLRHGPDICVRPGGITWMGGDSGFPDLKTLGDAAAVLESNAFELQVDPLVLNPKGNPGEPSVTDVPLGAPVRINFELRNKSGRDQMVPANLSLKSGHVRGKVVGPDNKVRNFSSLIKCMDEESLSELPKDKSKSGSMTLLRGPDGALFPKDGSYRVIVEVFWSDPKSKAPIRVEGETSVYVTKPEEKDSGHAKIAAIILQEKEMLWSVAVGGDHLVKGNALIHSAVHNSAYQVLRPHYAIVEAKRWARRHFTRQANIVTACNVLDQTTVVSVPECIRMIELIKEAVDRDLEKADPVVKKAFKILLEKLQNLGPDTESHQQVQDILNEVNYSDPGIAYNKETEKSDADVQRVWSSCRTMRQNKNLTDKGVEQLVGEIQNLGKKAKSRFIRKEFEVFRAAVTDRSLGAGQLKPETEQKIHTLYHDLRTRKSDKLSGIKLPHRRQTTMRVESKRD